MLESFSGEAEMSIAYPHPLRKEGLESTVVRPVIQKARVRIRIWRMGESNCQGHIWVDP